MVFLNGNQRIQKCVNDTEKIQGLPQNGIFSKSFCDGPFVQVRHRCT